MRWWQSIRWRLALGSALVALLATILLALAALTAIAYFYGSDQKARMNELAAARAQQVSVEFVQTKNLRKAANMVLPTLSTLYTQDQQYLMVVFDKRGRIVHPVPALTAQNQVIAGFLLRLVDPVRQQGDALKLRSAVANGEKGQVTIDELGRGWVPQPFVVRPIYADGQSSGTVIGVLLITPRSAVERTIPPFLATVGQAVLLAAIAVMIIAMVAAIIFSTTITRPLAKINKAARAMAAGDYQTHVATGAQGELGELATSFNEMAAQLNRDVEELRKQELWRRELIMSITHDLATPLTAIAGLGESLVDGVNQSHDDYEATGRIIVRETLRLRRLVKDLHIMGKVEAGALHPQKKPVRLAVLVDEVLAVLTPEFERVQVEPRNAVAHTLPAVSADPDMLTRVFSNLCDNALHYTPAGGSVTIEAMQVRDELCIAVTDTGPGIPPDALPRIFERFYRVDSARQSVTGGSGLGLAIVRAIITAHGGQIWAENAPQGGARIIFTLPLV